MRKQGRFLQAAATPSIVTGILAPEPEKPRRNRGLRPVGFTIADGEKRDIKTIFDSIRCDH